MRGREVRRTQNGSKNESFFLHPKIRFSPTKSEEDAKNSRTKTLYGPTDVAQRGSGLSDCGGCVGVVLKDGCELIRRCTVRLRTRFDTERPLRGATGRVRAEFDSTYRFAYGRNVDEGEFEDILNPTIRFPNSLGKTNERTRE